MFALSLPLFSPFVIFHSGLVLVDFPGLRDGDCAPAALSLQFFRCEQPQPLELRMHVSSYIKAHPLFFPSVIPGDITLIESPGTYVTEDFLRNSAIALNCPIIEHKASMDSTSEVNIFPFLPERILHTQEGTEVGVEPAPVNPETGPIHIAFFPIRQHFSLMVPRQLIFCLLSFFILFSPLSVFDLFVSTFAAIA